MARTDDLTNFLVDVAAAIKTKKGSQTNIPAANFDTEIASINTVNNQDKTITPTTSQQTVTADQGYTGIGTATVSAVTASIDQNITTNNIRKDVTILGVTGTLEEGIDTSDATATAGDIVSGKTAYANGQKLTGTITVTNDVSGTIPSVFVNMNNIEYVANINTQNSLLVDQNTEMVVAASIPNVLNTIGAAYDIDSTVSSISNIMINPMSNEMYWLTYPNISNMTVIDQNTAMNTVANISDVLGAVGAVSNIETTNSIILLDPTNIVLNSVVNIQASEVVDGTTNVITNIPQSNIATIVGLTPNILKLGETVLGVQGNLAPDKPDQTKTATPTTSQQVIEPDTGYELASVTVNAVTSSIDQNITAGNIKKDVTILGVTGTYEGSGSASPNIFVQTTEPTGKQGIWLQLADKAYTTVVAEDTIGGNPTWLPDGTARNIPYDFRLGMTAVIGTDIYLLSGHDEPTYAYKYNTLANTYTQLTDIPYEATNGSATAVGTDIYIFGGNNGATTAYKYNTLNDTYTQLTAIPYSFYGGAVVAVGTNIYLFGGESESQYAYKYNTSNGTYTQLTDIPYEFIYGSATAVGTDIYIFGGSEDNQKACKYDTLNDSYARLTDIPYELVSGSVAAKGTDVYIFGGINDAQKTYKYDTLGGTYTQMTNIPYSFQYGSAAAVGSNMYLFGDFTNTTKVQVLSFPAASFSDNSVVILNGSTYKTQLFTSQLVDTSVKYSFADVWFYTTQDGLIATTPTYYGDGTQWINIKNPPSPVVQDYYEIEYD